MKKETPKFVDQVYELLPGIQSGISYIIATKHTKVYPLLYFDEETGRSKQMRYAVNQESVFVEDQHGEILLEPVEFLNGQLIVPRTNQALQKFMRLSPDYGRKWILKDKAAEAQAEAEKMNLEADAIIAARELDVDKLERVCRVLFGSDVSKITTAELKRDISVYARNHPESFLHTLKDPSLDSLSDIQMFFDYKLLQYRNGKTEVYFNLPSRKTRLVKLDPKDKNPLNTVMQVLKTTDNLDDLQLLEVALEEAKGA